MTNYVMRGFYMDDNKPIELEGSLRADSAMIASQRSAPVHGKVKHILPRTHAARFTGYARLTTNQTSLSFIVRPLEDEFDPALYSFTRSVEQFSLDGSYNGSWIFLDPSLIRELPEEPNLSQLLNLVRASREEHGSEFHPAEITLTMGSVSRAFKNIGERVREIADALDPRPQPLPS